MAYTWDYFETYRLAQSDLERFLTDKFGHVNFFIDVGCKDAIPNLSH
jgi:hypothetical protein